MLLWPAPVLSVLCLMLKLSGQVISDMFCKTWYDTYCSPTSKSIENLFAWIILLIFELKRTILPLLLLGMILGDCLLTICWPPGDHLVTNFSVSFNWNICFRTRPMASIPTYQLELQMLKHQMTKGGGGPRGLRWLCLLKGHFVIYHDLYSNQF